MFNPQIKPVKSIKISSKSLHKNTYECSNGAKITESQIQIRLSKSYREKHEDNSNIICEGCESVKAQDNSHIISKKRLKQLHKTELIYNANSYCSYCRSCHVKWENYKSGEFVNLLNIVEAMIFVKKHDIELYNKMINV